MLSLEAAKQRLAELKPADFVSFMERWLITLVEWSGRLSVLSQVDLVDKAQAIEKALAELGLAQVVDADDDVVPSNADERHPVDRGIRRSLESLDRH